MPKCKPCLAAEVKQAILKEFGSEVETILASIPDCKPPELINVCGRKKRGGSAYNLWIGSCMKSKGIKSFSDAPAAMRACAKEWRDQKHA